MELRLRIKKTRSGTYYITSLSIKELRKMDKIHLRRWRYHKTKNEEYLILEAK
ncbi:MAG: hypothetical protein NWE89_04585 [Candidatus Bathyarchaeota archaeon]|nr:hypothetical protein [Candidatus Bathyarchaeota archaeon]